MLPTISVSNSNNKYFSGQKHNCWFLKCFTFLRKYTVNHDGAVSCPAPTDATKQECQGDPV